MVAASATAILMDITLSVFASVTPAGAVKFLAKTLQNDGLPAHCYPLALTDRFPRGRAAAPPVATE
jgi:hypothetical protein